MLLSCRDVSFLRLVLGLAGLGLKRGILSRPGIGNGLTRQRVSFGNTYAGLARMTHTSPHTFLIRFSFLIDSDSCSRLLRSLHIAHVHSSRTLVQESTSIHPRLVRCAKS